MVLIILIRVKERWAAGKMITPNDIAYINDATFPLLITSYNDNLTLQDLMINLETANSGTNVANRIEDIYCAVLPVICVYPSTLSLRFRLAVAGCPGVVYHVPWRRCHPRLPAENMESSDARVASLVIRTRSPLS